VQPDFDCVVIGAGLVGAAQALALQRLGLRVLAVDARQALGGNAGGDVRGLALAPSSRNILAGLGLWPTLAAHSVPVEEVRVSDQGRFGATRLHARDVGFEALGYVCPADQLMHALEAALVDAVPVRWQTTIDDINVADEAAFVTLRTGGAAETISTELVVGADGAESRVRELFGIRTTSRDYHQHAIVANLTVRGIEPRTAYERFTPQGPLALLPIGRERHVAVRCCAEADLERLLTLDDDAYVAELLRGFGSRFGKFSALGKRTHHPLRLARAQKITAERAVLVGAAANCIHPNGAQGLNLGLRDVAALAAAIRRNPGEDPGAPARLAAYADSRAADQRAVLRLTDALAQVFASRLPLVPLLRNAAMVAFDVMPPAKRWMIRRACGLFGETPLADWVPEA
jgi:2-octaprenyl-6-methoxyphenol hydroxylase